MGNWVVIALAFLSPAFLFAQERPLDFIYLDASTTHIHDRWVYAMEDGVGRMWFGSLGGGVAVYDGYAFSYLIHKPEDSLSLVSNHVLGLYYREKVNTMWVGTRRGVSVFDAASLLPLQRLFHFSDTTDSYFCEAIAEDKRGDMWIGTSRGLLRYAGSGAHQMFRIQRTPETPSDRSPNFIIRLAPDHGDPSLLWLASQYGLLSFDTDKETFTAHPNPPKWHTTHPNYQQYAMFDMQVSPDAVWLAGASSGGILRFDPAQNSWDQYRYHQSSPDDPYLGNQVGAILTIGDTVAFTTCDLGIMRADFAQANFAQTSHYDIGIGGYPRELYLDRNGVLWVMGNKAIARSKTPFVNLTADERKPILTDLNVDGDNYNTLDFQGRRRSFRELSLAFVLPNPAAPDQVTYRWKLDGFDNDWKGNDGRRQTNYTNLGPGKYTFHYAASTDGEQWSAGNPISFEIPKPFYLQWPYLVALFTLLGFLGWAGMRFIAARARKKEAQKQAHALQLARAEMSSLRSQMNPHFIFNSLNSIYNFIHKNDTEQAADYLAKFSRLIRNVLQNSKRSLISLSEELEVLQLYLELEQVRFDHKFEFSTHLDKAIDTQILQVPPMIIQPYLENAIWHGLMHKSGQGLLNIDLQMKADKLQITIEDDGIGREKSRAINASRKSGKKSLGMEITSTRIEMINLLNNMNAEHQITDLVNPDGSAAGTRVTLTLPIIKT